MTDKFLKINEGIKCCTQKQYQTLILGLFAATASGSSKQAWRIPDALCAVFELLMMGGETARNMQGIDTNKEYCTTLHLVGCTEYRNNAYQFGASVH